MPRITNSVSLSFKEYIPLVSLYNNKQRWIKITASVWGENGNFSVWQRGITFNPLWSWSGLAVPPLQGATEEKLAPMITSSNCEGPHFETGLWWEQQVEAPVQTSSVAREGQSSQSWRKPHCGVQVDSPLQNHSRWGYQNRIAYPPIFNLFHSLPLFTLSKNLAWVQGDR